MNYQMLDWNVAFARAFWRRVAVGQPDECWPWKLSMVKPKGSVIGYGQFIFRGKRYRANRVAFFLANGRWPKYSACHTCDNPPCCNPDHIYDGTQLDNVRDMMKRNRGNISKLTQEQKLEILEAKRYWGSDTHLASKFGVSDHTIRKIRRTK